ncbi:MAG: NADH-quinone oxidoreductase subunit J [Myxococcaceae bacterium]
MSLIFYISSGGAIFSTFMAMISRQAIHALLYFVLSTLFLSLAIYDMGAPFAAVLEVIIYAGAIMVLFVFVVMLLNPNKDLSRKSLLVPGLLSLGFIAEMCLSLPTHPVLQQTSSAPSPILALFQNYGTLVELVSFILLAGLLAAYRIGKK